MALTEKQKQYLKEADHRWNFKVGAARSGKTWCDLFTVPMRIRALEEKGETGGLIVLMGYTVGTLCRNLLDPMRELWGEELVGQCGGKSDSILLFGRKCYLMSADKVTGVERLQGASIAYCYGDEVATWSEEVFSMLKSRLDRAESRFDGTCNPAHPTHWLKRFLDSDADVYVQHYTLEDNPHLSERFKENLKREYAGTVWYDRLILGRWVAAEGVIYREFADHPERFTLTEEAEAALMLSRITVGVDFGGTKSGTSFVAMGYTAGFGEAVALSSVRFFGEVDLEDLVDRFLTFLMALLRDHPISSSVTVYCDSAEPILIRTLKHAVDRAGVPVMIRKARKGPIRDRIRLTLALMSQGRFRIGGGAQSLIGALSGAVWDPGEVKDVRLDDGSSDIDSLDAMEYAMEPFCSRLLSLG